MHITILVSVSALGPKWKSVDQMILIIIWMDKKTNRQTTYVIVNYSKIFVFIFFLSPSSNPTQKKPTNKGTLRLLDSAGQPVEWKVKSGSFKLSSRWLDNWIFPVVTVFRNLTPLCFSIAEKRQMIVLLIQKVFRLVISTIKTRVSNTNFMKISFSIV